MPLNTPNKYLYAPFPKAHETQGFSKNANVLYARQGLHGHTAKDYGGDWDSPIANCAPGAKVFSVINEGNPDPSKYRAVYTIYEIDDTYADEISYGHLNKISVAIGTVLDLAQTIGTMGNTGSVFSGLHEVTKEERLAGSRAGTHLHGPQVRACKKVKTRTKPSSWYLRNADGYVKSADGRFYETLDYNNGFNGCIDPEIRYNGQVIGERFQWTRDLYVGISGPDVLKLQKFLNDHGLRVAENGPGSPGRETDFYGVKTQLAVAKFQKIHAVAPAAGFFGAKTRAVINRIK